MLATSNEIRCVLHLATIFIMSSRSVSKKNLIVLKLAKEPPGAILGINTLYTLNNEKCCGLRYAIVEIRIVMSDGYSGKFLQRQCKIQLSRDILGKKKVLKSAFCRLSKSLKSEILATMVPPPGYTGFIANLLFWATRRLESMLAVSFSCIVNKITWRYRSSQSQMFFKIGVLEKFVNFTGNTTVLVIKFKLKTLSPATLLKKTLTQVFSCKICEIFKNTFFYSPIRVATS